MKFFQSTLLGLIAMTATTTSAFSLAPVSRSPFSLMMSDAAVEEATTSSDEPVKHTVYVGNLPFSSNREQIETMFAEKGISVLNVAMPMNQDRLDQVTGLPVSKGFCFVDVESEEMIVTAVEAFNQMDLDGRPMRVNKLLPKEEVEKQQQRPKNFTPEGTCVVVVPNATEFLAGKACVASLGCLVDLTVQYNISPARYLFFFRASK